jgi:hypothetical protein
VLESGVSANFIQFSIFLTNLEIFQFLIPKFLEHSDIAVRIIQDITAQMEVGVELTFIAQLATLFTVSQNVAVRVGGLYAMINICTINSEFQKQWLEDQILLDCIFGFLRDSAFEERMAAMEFLGKLFEESCIDGNRMTEDVVEAFLDIMNSGEEKCIQIVLKLIIKTIEQNEENGIDICEMIEEKGMEEVIEMICDECSGVVYTLLMEYITLRNRVMSRKM